MQCELFLTAPNRNILTYLLTCLSHCTASVTDNTSISAHTVAAAAAGTCARETTSEMPYTLTFAHWCYSTLICCKVIHVATVM